jgi:hypothetical protein
MLVHLIKSKEVDSELFDEVVQVLNSIKGPIKYKADYSLIEINSTELASWNILFDACSNYRKKHAMRTEDFVLVLTGIPNNFNWFSSLDEKFPTNGFVHVADWSKYLECPAIYPVAYLIVTLILQKYMFSNYAELLASVHHAPLGCINDFCSVKKEIILKLRTADICGSCFDQLIKNNTPSLMIDQVQDTMETIRVRMLYSQNFKRPKVVSRLVIRRTELVLKDYENISISLRPLEMCLYVLFLRHAEGIRLVDLVDHKEEIIALYNTLSNTAMPVEIISRVNQLVDVNTNSASEKISKIKLAFTKLIGSDLADQYIIQGKNAEVKIIKLNRDKLIWN